MTAPMSKKLTRAVFLLSWPMLALSSWLIFSATTPRTMLVVARRGKATTEPMKNPRVYTGTSSRPKNLPTMM